MFDLQLASYWLATILLFGAFFAGMALLIMGLLIGLVAAGAALVSRVFPSSPGGGRRAPRPGEIS